MNIVFFGASKFGLRCLKQLLTVPDIRICGVLTAPRTFNISYSPGRSVTNILHRDFHSICKESSIPIEELSGKMNDPSLIEIIKKGLPDFILVAGWYHNIPREILMIPSKGVAGFHAALLPLYRGGAPLVWAIINGERTAGLSLFYFDKGVDTGDIIDQRPVSIKFNDNIASVYERIEELALSMIADMIPLIARGDAPRLKQGELPAGHPPVWPQRCPEDGHINWFSSAIDIYNFVRAQTRPYPGAFTTLHGQRLIIWECKLFDRLNRHGSPGEVTAIIDEGPLKGILVATADGDCPILLTEIEFNERIYKGTDLVKLKSMFVGEIFCF